MKFPRLLALLASGFALPTLGSAANYEWTFNDGTLSDFFGNGTMTPVGATTSNILTTDGTSVPHINGQPARYLNVPVSLNIQDGFSLALNASGANGGGAYLNNYTFVFDVFSPGAADWQALFQTDPTNGNDNDADWYIAPDSSLGIGALGYSAVGAVTQNAWHRLTFAAALGSEVKFYVDGLNVATIPTNGIDGRFALYSGADAGDDVRLFNEGDTSGNYTHALYVNSIAFVDRELSDAEVATLGGPNAAGILVPEPAAAALVLPALAGFAARRRRPC